MSVRATLRLALLACACVLAGAAFAQPAKPPGFQPVTAAQSPAVAPVGLPQVAQTISGVWTLAQAGTPRKCLLQFNPQERAGGYFLGLRYACKLNVMALTPFAVWTVDKDRRIMLATAKGDLVVPFERAAPGRYIGKLPNGDEFVLEPSAGPNDKGERARAIDAAITGMVLAATATPEGGRFEVFRGGAVDTGCVLVLDGAKEEKNGQKRAVIEPGCKDSGLQIFDPAAWRTDRDRLFLIARKGHSMGFNQEKFGYVKDPVKGSPLVLRRL